MTEGEFQAAVVELARMCGWRCLHVRRSIGKGHRWATTTSVVGWPDLFLWRDGDALAVELKSEGGKPTADQLDVLASLERAGIDARIWRPSDLDAIARRLNRHTHRTETA